jgi:hypothetical protein
MIPELPTDVNIRSVLDSMVSYFELKSHVPVVMVNWADAVPQAMLDALNSERGSWILRTSDTEFMFGHKASDIGENLVGTVYVPLQVTPDLRIDDP